MVLQYLGLTGINGLVTCWYTEHPTADIFTWSIIWILYLEFGIGGILRRKNDFGDIVFKPIALCELLCNPFRESTRWHPRFWDLNLYMVLIGSKCLKTFLCNYNVIAKRLFSASTSPP